MPKDCRERASKILTPYFRELDSIDGVRSASLMRPMGSGGGEGREGAMDQAWRELVRQHRQIRAVLHTLDEATRGVLWRAFGTEKVPRELVKQFTYPGVALVLPVTIAAANGAKKTRETFLRGIAFGGHRSIKEMIERRSVEAVRYASSDFIEAMEEQKP